MKKIEQETKILLQHINTKDLKTSSGEPRNNREGERKRESRDDYSRDHKKNDRDYSSSKPSIPFAPKEQRKVKDAQIEQY